MTEIRTMRQDEWQEVASLIKLSTAAWYKEHFNQEKFGCNDEDMLLFPRVYEALDPDHCLVAIEDEVIAASCFHHVRPTHHSLGIMNVHPDYGGRSLGRKLIQTIIKRAEADGVPLRLVSSAMNLDSFSLYNKSGFQVLAFFQDMLVEVPVDGLRISNDNDHYVRAASIDDVDDIVALEMDIHGVNKERDYRYFLQDDSGVWELLVYDDGDIRGVLLSIKSAPSNIVGHGVMQDADIATALIYRGLDRYRGGRPLVIIPSDSPELVQSMYAIKAKNSETHVLQVYKPDTLSRPDGIVIPTFMPENG